MIRFDCSACGKKLTVPDDRAGKLGKCPTCKETFRIPSGEAEDEIPEELEIVDEPPDRSSLPAGLSRAGSRQADEDNRVDSLLRQDVSDRSLAKKPKKRKGRRSDDGFFSFITNIDPLIWIFGIGGFTCVMTLIMGFIYPPVAMVPGLFGSLAAICGGVWLLIKAFQDDAMQGLACLCVPCYSIYYAITHFDEVKYPFCIAISGQVVSFLAGAITGELSRTYDYTRTRGTYQNPAPVNPSPAPGPGGVPRRVLAPLPRNPEHAEECRCAVTDTRYPPCAKAESRSDALARKGITLALKEILPQPV
jgi:hypothetical protein